MKALFLGGDKRSLEVIDYLKKRNYDITTVGYEINTLDRILNNIDISKVSIKEYDLIFFPVNGLNMDLSISCEYSRNPIYLESNMFEDIKQETIVFTGIMTKKLEEILKIGEKEAIVIMDDQQVKIENSIPTVEGIIGDLIYNMESTINGTNILVLGYGNIGKRLVNSLISLNSIVTVGVIEDEDHIELTKKKIPCIYTNNHQTMKNIIENSEIIINTVPTLIINSEYLKIVNRDTYILDISSYPHGVDFKTADGLNIKNKLLLGIPGNIAPKTAGKILVKKINSILEEEN